jgi:tetratricopeptide (TPR) repeat protein
MTVKRAVRIGCLGVVGLGCGSLHLLVFLYVVAWGAMMSPEAQQRKKSVKPSRPAGMVLADGSRWNTVPGMPLPPIPEDVARGTIVFYGRVVRVLRSFGDTPALGRGYLLLAALHASAGDAEEADRLFGEARRVLEKTGGTPNDLAWVHFSQGIARSEQGRYTDALRSLQAAAAATQEPQFRAAALQNMAICHLSLGQHAKAEQKFLGALDVVRTLGAERTFVDQAVRSNFAVFYEQIGDLENARHLLEPLDATKGLEPMLRIQVLNNLAYLYAARREFAKAEATFARAERLIPKRHPYQAAVLTNRTMMLNRAGQFARAEVVGKEAHRVTALFYGEDSSQAAAALTGTAMAAMRRGDLAAAKQMLARASAIFKQQVDQEFLATSLRQEALVAHRLGDEESARRLGLRALELTKLSVDRILAFGSEPQRLSYLSEAAPFDAVANMGMPDLLADAVLALKGTVLESMIAERTFARASSPSDQQQLDAINHLKVTITESIAAGDRDTQAIERDLKRRQRALAERLALHLERTQQRIDLQSVQAKLERDQVFVDIVRYQRYADSGDVIAYGAVVIPPSGPAAWVPLADGTAIEEKIACFVERYGGGRGFGSDSPCGNVVTILRDLHDDVWRPLAKSFPRDTRRVLLSPDGAMCFVPWAALLDDRQRFLAERWEVTQIGSGRDLLRTPRAASGNELLALGDGANDLKFSRTEIDAIESAARRGGWTVTKLLGDDALERSLALHPQPRILHMATHAGRLRSGADHAVQTRLSLNPMSRGYVLLGGGRHTLDSWDRGLVEPFADDGILTAEEASTLDLRNTWLTVVSACHSGAGDARAGDGVMGLRRGFALAGSENLLLALWAVDDESGADFMKAFYGRVFSTTDPARAFHQTQRAELARWKRLEGVEEAVRHAGGFVMTR